MDSAFDLLVVDDDDAIRATLVEILRWEGYRVEGATDGVDALARLRRSLGQPPSLILLDLMMPGMNGFEFRSKQLADPQLASIPVLVLTGDSRATEKGADLGAAAAISKPVELGELLATLERLRVPRAPPEGAVPPAAT